MHIPDTDSLYDPPIKPEQLTDEEFNQTWSGIPGTIKIGVLLPFTDPDRGYRTIMSRISLSVLRMAVEDMNNNHVIPGMNLSLVVRDSQRPITGTNATGGAAAISATTRLLAMGVGAAIGDIASELTQAEALMTSSLGVPQCSFATYSNDIANLRNYPYLFRSSPGVLTFYDALAAVIEHYGWKRISILHTSDVPGFLGEKRFTLVCEERGIDVKKVAIPITESQDDFAGSVRSALKTIKYSDTRIHVLVVSRPNMVNILDMARDYGLFTGSHVWLTAIDISDSMARLRNPSDFNGLIFADVLWDKPGFPAYDAFVGRWTSLDPEKYPGSGGVHLSWHETFAYTCVQVIAEGYKGLVENAKTLTKPLERDHILWDVLRGKRSPDMTLKYLGSRSYDTPVGEFQLSEDGIPMNLGVSIRSFQNTTSIQNGNVKNHTIDIFNPIHFNDGTTNVPGYAPHRSEVNPSFGSPFGITMIVLTTILQFAIVFTIVIVLWNRENIIIKSASPLFCVLELLGILVTLCWIYLRVDAPGDAVCRLGLMPIIIGLTINLSALVVKNYRIYRIFNSASVINHAVSNIYLLRVVSFPVIITLFLSLLHVFIHYLEPKLIRTSNSQVWMICSSDQVQFLWTIVIGLTPILLNVFGIYLAFKTRNVTRLWNEARAIAATIYLVCFFIVIIIIVQVFPTSAYPITYYVTMIAVYVACLLEYLILFYPKLRNLFLQKRGLYVSAGRDEALMDSILGGGMAPNRRNPSVTSADILHGEKDPREGSADIMTGGEPSEDSRRGSAGSTSNDTQNPNTSDLVSSCPFGQLHGDHLRAASLTSPVHVPTVYGPSLVNRGQRRGSADQGLKIEHLDLSDPQGGARATQQIRGARTMSVPRIGPMKRYGSDTVTQGQQIGDRASSALPYDLHEVLMASSNGLRSEGMLTVDACGYSRSMLSSSFLGMDPSFHDSAISHSASEYGGRSRESSADYGGMGIGRGHRLIPPSRSSKQNPLQLSADHPHHTSFMSARRSIRETRMDSYTVIVPVQRQRWYILRVLGQWRMSKIIFVPYSKVLVIIDLETEKSASLIVHSIEQGYSEDVTQKLAEKRRQVSDPAVISRPKKTPVASQVKTDPVEKTGSSETIEAATLAPTVPASMAQPGVSMGLNEVVSGPPPSGSQVSPATVVPSASSPQTAPTGPRLNSKASDKDALAPQASFSTSRANSNQTIPSTNPPAGETGTRSSMRRLSTIPIINNVRKLSLTFDMDMRNMDGMLEPPVVNDIESDMSVESDSVESDYVIRIISIHNECWRVQLPDQETMDRWIEIGRQIKDENWITTSRPLPQSSTKSITNSRLPDSGEARSVVAGSGSSGEWTSVGDGQKPPLGLPPLRTRSSSSKMLHPLQSPDEADLDQASSEPIEVQGYPQSNYSDITNSSRSSSDTEERQKGRERAAKMNQKLRETSKANKLLKSLRPSGDPLGSQPSGASGALTPFKSRFEHTKDVLHRAYSDPAQPRRASHLNIEIFPGSDETSPTAPVKEVVSDPTNVRSQQPTSSKLFVDTKVSPAFGSTSIRKRDRVQSFEDGMYGTKLDELDESVDDPMNKGQRDEIEHAHLKDILSETRIAYTNGQHAIYDTENHRRHRYFGSLQYNYDDKNRFRSKDLYQDDQEFPESPEWHLTSSDLLDLEHKHGLMYNGEGYFDGRHHSVGALDHGHDTVRSENLNYVLTLSVTEPESSEQEKALLEMEERPKDLESLATARLSPMIPKFEVGRQDPYKDANTTEGEARPLQAQPTPDTDSELRQAVGQARSHWGDNGGGVGGASDVVDPPGE